MAKTRNGINEDISFKQRLNALKNLPAFFELVWQSSPSKTLFSFLLGLSAHPASPDLQSGLLS